MRAPDDDRGEKMDSESGLWRGGGVEGFAGFLERLSRLSAGPVNDDLQGSMRAMGAAGNVCSYKV